VRVFQIERIAQQELEQGVGWYEHERLGLGFEFIEEVDRVSPGSRRKKSS
jgi:hypothetical protein